MVFCGRCMEKLGENPICPHCGYDNRMVQDIPYALKPGSILNGKYLIGNVLGQGGFGITYVGFDLALELRVAIKEYYVAGSASRVDGKSQAVYWTHNPDHMDHFITEARRMAKLDKMPEVALVRDVFYANNTAYIIMEFVEGVNLKDHLKKHGIMSYEQAVKLMLPVIMALGRVHGKNLIHRDISPDNLMMEPDGTLRVLDLGAAGDLSRNNGQASQMVARHGFSPYEQYIETGSIGPWTDVYAVCATLYYCCTGKVIPGAYARVDRLIKTQDSRLQMDPAIPASAVEVLQKGLALNTENRIQNMQELAAQLEATLVPGNTAPEKKTPAKQPVVVTPAAPAEKPAPEEPKKARSTGFYNDDVQDTPKQTRSTGFYNDDTQERESPDVGKYKPRSKKKLIIAAAVLVVAVLVFGRFGWHQNKDGQYQYYRFGVPARDWVNTDGKYFYFSDDGFMMTSWQQIDGKQYYFGSSDGMMRTGWQTIDDSTYYFGNDGVMRTGWQVISGTEYFFDYDGRLYTG